MNKKEKSKNKIKLFLTQLMSWKVVLIIFLVNLLPDLWIKGQIQPLGEVLRHTFVFVIFYHLLITFPSVMLYNIKNKYLKTFIHFLVLIALVIVFLGIPMYEAVQQDEENYIKSQQYEDGKKDGLYTGDCFKDRDVDDCRVRAEEPN